MNEQVTAEWAEICRSAQGPQALRIVESALLSSMKRERKLEAQLAAFLLPDPKHSTVRAHGLHLLDRMTGALIPVTVDYEMDEGEVIPLYVWIASVDVMSFLTPEEELRLSAQIAGNLQRDAAEIRAEMQAEMRAAA